MTVPQKFLLCIILILGGGGCVDFVGMVVVKVVALAAVHNAFEIQLSLNMGGML